MHIVSHFVREFFERYERSRNTMDAGLIDEQYPDAFMFAGPSGARIAEKATVMSTLAKGHQLFKTLGHTSTTLASLNEMALDEHYTLLRAKFVWRFAQPSPQPIDVEVDPRSSCSSRMRSPGLSFSTNIRFPASPARATRIAVKHVARCEGSCGCALKLRHRDETDRDR